MTNDNKAYERMIFMFKKMTITLLLALGILGTTGCSYYNDTYKGVEAYARIPDQVPEKVETKDKDGKVQAGLYSYQYNLEFITKDEVKQSMDVEVTDESPTPFTPGSYVKAKISKKRIIEGPNSVDESKIPKDVLKMME